MVCPDVAQCTPHAVGTEVACLYEGKSPVIFFRVPGENGAVALSSAQPQQCAWNSLTLWLGTLWQAEEEKPTRPF